MRKATERPSQCSFRKCALKKNSHSVWVLNCWNILSISSSKSRARSMQFQEDQKKLRSTRPTRHKKERKELRRGNPKRRKRKRRFKN